MNRHFRIDINGIDLGKPEGEIELQGVGAMIVICEECGKKYRKDEVGELAEAIARMQDSIRLSIERLRRRR
jgi:HAMP domain-containing protein